MRKLLAKFFRHNCIKKITERDVSGMEWVKHYKHWIDPVNHGSNRSEVFSIIVIIKKFRRVHTKKPGVGSILTKLQTKNCNFTKNKIPSQVFSSKFNKMPQSSHSVERLWTVVSGMSSKLTLYCLISTKRTHILKQICSWKMQVCISVCGLLVDTRY